MNKKPFDKDKFESFEAMQKYALSISDLLERYHPSSATGSAPKAPEKPEKPLIRRKWRLGE